MWCGEEQKQPGNKPEAFSVVFLTITFPEMMLNNCNSVFLVKMCQVSAHLTSFSLLILIMFIFLRV